MEHRSSSTAGSPNSPSRDEARYPEAMNDQAARHHGRVHPGAPRTARTLVLGLALSSVMPFLIAVYLCYASPRLGLDLPWVLLCLALAAVGSVAGGVILWRLAVPPRPAAPPAGLPEPGRTGSIVVPPEHEQGADHVRDAMDSFMDSFSQALSGIEQEADEVNQYAVRLDNAYKEIETSNAQLKEFSFKDVVTGLYNRRFFSIRLEEEVSRYRRFNHPVSVVLLDLDGFKAVNDELGHAAGDETLRGMAEILLKHSRGINVISRYGGDEFAVLLVETSKAGARLYADRIRYVLPTYRFGHGRRITASFGIASLPEDVVPGPDELIRAADEALYAAKRAGKNRVSVHEDIVGGSSAARISRPTASS
jgi:diguanylate cyclase (GGDEF)-like protein